MQSFEAGKGLGENQLPLDRCMRFLYRGPGQDEKGTAMKVLLVEQIHQDGIAILEEAAQVVMPKGFSEEDLIAGGKDAEAIIIRYNGTITEKVMKACPRLRCVARHGVGVDNVDVQAATRLKLPVLYTPGANHEAVAEHTILLMLAVCRKLCFMDREVRKGRWQELRRMRLDDLLMDLKGRVLGVVGVGRIGTRVAELAGAFGMEVLGYDPYLPPEELKRRGVKATPFDDLLTRSDIVSLHVPLTSETRHLIGRRELQRMRQGAILINTARGGLVDEQALFEALREGRLAGAGLDVVDPEPPAPDNPLFQIDSVVISPHTAGLTEAAMRAMAVTVASEVVKVLRGEKPTLVANPEVLER